jgi:polyisoprenoid-binding protein YceI
MRTLKMIIILILTFSSLKITAQKLDLIGKESNLTWTGKAAFSSYSLTGTLKAKAGFIKIADNTITDLKIIINMKSLNHENKDLTKHLRGKDFFEVNTFPEAFFEIYEPIKIVDNKAILLGKMTINGITKEEIISVLINKKSMSFECELNRTDYGVKFNSPSFFKKMKENAIADNFLLNGELVFKLPIN